MASRPARLLFVCSANVCRSPLAAGLMAYNADQAGATVRVSSASLDSEVRPFHPTTVTMLAGRGIDLARSMSQPLNDDLVDGADLILVMTSDHARGVVGRFPRVRPKVFVLEHLASHVQPANDGDDLDRWLQAVRRNPRDYSRDERWDIQDPNHQSDAIYRAVEVQIDNATNWLATVLSTVVG